MAVDMFIKIWALKGESRDKTHKEEIDVLAWSWGLSNSGSAHVGGGAGAGKCNVQDLSFTKYIDKTSPDLMLACCNGKHFDKATLVVRKAVRTPWSISPSPSKNSSSPASPPAAAAARIA